jgi:hypothetical protein
VLNESIILLTVGKNLDAGKYGGALALKFVATSSGLHNIEVTFWDAWFTIFKDVLLPGFSAIFF